MLRSATLLLCTVSVTFCLLAGAPPASAASISVPGDASSISAGLLRAAERDTVWVGDGVYREHVVLPHGITLLARTQFRAVIDGGGRGTVLTMGKNTTISGFTIRNGTMGIFSSGANNAIRSCRVVRNWQSGVVCVRHLPLMEDNVIAFNRGSGVQCWDARSSSASVNHNTIVYNANNGIAVGGSSSFVVENNIIAFNERFGIKVLDEAENVRIANNNLFQNLNPPGGRPQGNFSFDPAFVAPRARLNFSSDPKRCCTIKGADNENLGARLMY
jgi:hypothetical protein